ncbi:hypothetical protein HY631_01485 [Candidatus Uhrbacteria bacterium]|nr:hypothetical protein [Candidatus Uhrbacteria bacterium]
MDPDGIDWTHLVGELHHTLLPDELPEPLRESLLPILSWIVARGLHELPLGADLTGAPDDAQATLELTAWWLEWNRRRRNARGHFNCTHCGKPVAVQTQGAKTDTTIYSCPDNACQTWELLCQITGKATLRVIDAESA